MIFSMNVVNTKVLSNLLIFMVEARWFPVTCETYVNTWSWLAIFANVEHNHVMMNKWRQQDMEVSRAYFIPFVLVKDGIVVGPHVILNTASHLASRITRSDHKAE